MADVESGQCFSGNRLQMPIPWKVSLPKYLPKMSSFDSYLDGSTRKAANDVFGAVVTIVDSTGMFIP